MRLFWLLTITLCGVFCLVWPARAATVGQRYAGYIVTTADAPAVYWYIDPRTHERVPASTPNDLHILLRDRGVRITATNLRRIPVAGTSSVGDVAYRRREAGYFLVVPSLRNQAWYVLPRQKRRLRVGNGSAISQFLATAAVTIPTSDLNRIPTPATIQLVQGNVLTTRGTFWVDRLSFDWTDPTLRIATDTANATDCKTNCPVLSLGTFVTRRRALAGIHGTYFCPQDYSWCSAKRNSFNTPVWNTFTRSWLNGGQIKYAIEPLVAFDSTNRPFLYAKSLIFHSQADFLTRFTADSKAAGGSGVLQAAISNGPLLMTGGQIVLRANQLDTKQATVKAPRGGFGWQGNRMVFFVAKSATVTDLAAVAQALGLENAVNLDGGGSSAIYRNGKYILGPGRSLPNALLITSR